ncbi:hypothetical protein KA107_01480 [Candidatus Pacearchaeota archaeon]|nr:hypothetical protein [Candidatus Pacearchaeota archaeon]
MKFNFKFSFIIFAFLLIFSFAFVDSVGFTSRPDGNSAIQAVTNFFDKAIGFFSGSSGGGLLSSPNVPAPNPSAISAESVQAAMDAYYTTWNDAEYYNPASDRGRNRSSEVDELDNDLTAWVNSHQNAFTQEQINEFDTGSTTASQLFGNGREDGSGIYSTLQKNLKTAKVEEGWFSGGGSNSGGTSSGSLASSVTSSMTSGQAWDFVLSGKVLYGFLLGLILAGLGWFLSDFEFFKQNPLSKYLTLTKWKNLMAFSGLVWILFNSIVWFKQLSLVASVIWICISIYNIIVKDEKEISNHPLLILPATFLYFSVAWKGVLDPKIFIHAGIIVGLNSLSAWLDYFFDRLKKPKETYTAVGSNVRKFLGLSKVVAKAADDSGSGI